MIKDDSKKDVDFIEVNKIVIETLKGSRNKFMKSNQLKVDCMMHFYYVVGFLFHITISYSCKTNGIKNSLIKKKNILLANKMLNLSKYTLQGNTTRRKLDKVHVKLQAMEVPPIVKEFYNDAEILANIIFTNNVLFLTWVSHNIYYEIANVVANSECSTIENILMIVIWSYSIRGFNIVIINVNKYFKALKDCNEVEIKFNIVSKEEHIPVIEYFRWVIKEHYWCNRIIFIVKY